MLVLHYHFDYAEKCNSSVSLLAVNFKMDFRLTNMELARLFRSTSHRLKPLLSQFTWQHRCLMCAEASESRICSPCEAYWPLQRHYCQRCSLPLAQHALLCGDCIKKSPTYDNAYAPYLYAPPLNQLILKFKNQHDLGTGLALCEHWRYQLKQHYHSQHITLPQFLAPVPTHWRRQWQRGFSHTQFCAEELGRFFSIPVLHQTQMQHHTDAQKSLSRKQRLNMLSSAFVVNADLNGMSVAIVDDVMTTGATANAFATALKAAGAHTVAVWVLARTPKQYLNT